MVDAAARLAHALDALDDAPAVRVHLEVGADALELVHLGDLDLGEEALADQQARDRLLHVAVRDVDLLARRGSGVAEHDAGDAEAAVIGARAPGQVAAVVETRRARVARQLLQRLVVARLDERLALLGVLRDELFALLLSGQPALLRHR